MNLLAKDIFDVFASYGFTVIPLFVLMGQVAYNAGIAKRLYDSSYKFIGHIPGGLALATVAGATVFKAICGSSPATAATFASVAVPEMDRYGYDRRLSTGVVASVGTLGILIPPSVTLIVFGIITEQSIGRLFLAGIVPGLHHRPVLRPDHPGLVRRSTPPSGPRGRESTWKERLASLPELAWVLLVFVRDHRRADEGLLHAHRGGQRGDLRGDPARRGPARHEAAGLRQVAVRVAAHRLHGPDADRRLHRARPFPRRDPHPHDRLGVGGGRCP